MYIFIQTLWSVSAPGVMSLGFRLIFLCWPLEPDSQAEAVSAGSQQTAVSVYTSSWKNSFWKPRVTQTLRFIPFIVKAIDISQRKEGMQCSHVSTRWRSWLTFTRGTLKATGSMLVLVSSSPTAISTSRTLHSVLGRKAKPCGQETIRKWQSLAKFLRSILQQLWHFGCPCVQMYGDLTDQWKYEKRNGRKREFSSLPYVAQKS